MTILNNARFAILLTALVVLASTLSGAASSLGELRGEAERGFYSAGANDNTGIQYNLDRIEANCQNLVAVAQRYMGEDNGDIAAAKRGIEELQAARAPSEKKLAAADLVMSARYLAGRLEDKGLSEGDRAYIGECVGNILAHEDAMSKSGYNKAALEFNDTLSRFPANALGRLTGIKPLELFAV